MRYRFRLDGVLGNASKYVGLTAKDDDDFIDRISHHYSTIILVIFTVIVSTKQYVGDPIECWCPAQFTDVQTKYTSYVCWVSNTYYVPFRDPIPITEEPKKDKEIVYYQWVPFILLFQALLFKMPRILWRIVASMSGVCMETVISMAAEMQYKPPEDRKKQVDYVVNHVDRWLVGVKHYNPGICLPFREKVAKYCCVFCGRRYGNYLMTCNLFIKALYVTNAVCQLYVVNSFLGGDYILYGFHVLEAFLKGEDWSTSDRFPRVTLCDFEIRQLQNVQKWTVQCVLPINLFNEKIFLFIWFWLILIAALSAFNLLLHIVAVLFPQQRMQYLKKYLHTHRLLKTGGDKKLAKLFVDRYLRQDGVFLLRMISHNASDVVASDLIYELWHRYRNKKLVDVDDDTNV